MNVINQANYVKLQKGLPQPAYQGNNWFTSPALPNNLQWAQATAMQQYQNNQAAYPGNGWPVYPNGGYNTERDSKISPPISDWSSGDQVPGYTPVAGGKGWGTPSGAGDIDTSTPGEIEPASNTTAANPSASVTPVGLPSAHHDAPAVSSGKLWFFIIPMIALMLQMVES